MSPYNREKVYGVRLIVKIRAGFRLRFRCYTYPLFAALELPIFGAVLLPNEYSMKMVFTLAFIRQAFIKKEMRIILMKTLN